MNLPQEFLDKMKNLLGSEYESFVKSYEEERRYGIRRNPLKVEQEKFEQMPFGLSKVPWAAEGYYYDNDTRPGRHPYHEAGAYYIQEPSAMVVAELLEVKPGDTVLDLCAAPGGKSTQIAGKMQGRGFLVSNEINPQRVKILSQNIERFGIRNAVVLNESSDRLSEKFRAFFDKILVDAPCSGEGMFRKDENAASEWSLMQVEKCAERQLFILENAAKMLKAGGTLVYSTCTFSPEENECVISQFLKSHREFELCECKIYEKVNNCLFDNGLFDNGLFDNGHREWAFGDEEVAKCIRLWPHRLGGEGHFAAKLIKRDGEIPEYEQGQNVSKKIELSLYKEFMAQYIREFDMEGDCIMFGEQLYMIPKNMLSLKGMKVIRPGLHLGTNKKKRFEPAHALAMALTPQEVRNVKDMEIESAVQYLKGETIPAEGEEGWTLMSVNHISTGWGKGANGIIKNHYPKGLRVMSGFGNQ